MILDDWAKRWDISRPAIDDLRTRLRGILPAITNTRGESESAVQAEVRLEAAEKGIYLWRNNVGALTTDDGRFIRYGLANDSKPVNNIIKSADLIGIRPLIITQEMIGWTVGQFVSREIKGVKWRYSGTDREQAQTRWAELILSLGGDAGFAIGRGTL